MKSLFLFLCFLLSPGLCSLSLFAESSAANRQCVILVIGADGKPEYGEMFRTWAARWKLAAEGAGAEIHLVGGGVSEIRTESSPATSGPPVASGKSVGQDLSAEASVESDLSRLQRLLTVECHRESTEPLWIVFLGHGTDDGRTAAFNLVGPDVTASLMAGIVRDSTRPMNIVVCASCSAPFLQALSRPGRVIITSTRDGRQIQFSRFGDAMSIAVSSATADTDRDGQTSLLEAWQFAAQRTTEVYESMGQLATEHSLLDDNGDGRGTRAQSVKVSVAPERPDVHHGPPGDGALAAERFLHPDPVERNLSTEQRKIRDELERQIVDLRKQQEKDPRPEEEYLGEMEKLLRPLAELYESLRVNSETAK